VRQDGFRAGDADFVGNPDFIQEQPGVGLPELRWAFVELFRSRPPAPGYLLFSLLEQQE
jgi:hypothetical protein